MDAVIKSVVKNLFNLKAEVELTRPDEQFGDYTTNVALHLAGKLNKPPREVAQQIADALKIKLKNESKDVTVAGPGFINITLTDDALLREANRAPTTKPQTYKGKVVVAEYSDPNPFKELHAGHLYTTVVGDVIANLLESVGATVHRVNYGGDVGLHVGRAMWGIIQHLGGEHPQKLNDVPAKERAMWLSQRYVEGNVAYESDPAAKAEIIATNKHVYQLHTENEHDTPFAQIYWTCRQWSYDAFVQLYKKLHIQAFERFIAESEVTPKGVAVVEKGLHDGVFVKSDGAVVFKGEPHGLHTRVFITSVGLPTYEAKDLGLAVLKWSDYKFDQSFIITGNDQTEYMKVVVAALGHFYPQAAERGQHSTHGMIRLPGGKKMSSRLGNNPRALDILDAAAQAAKQLVGSEDTQASVGAVKYALLKHRIGSDIVYDAAESVSLDGNSGPYLQYAHARARSILAKVPAGSAQVQVAEFEPLERSLARKISEYPEAISKAVAELMPHHVCTYLYELAQTFNRFYEKSRVVGSGERQALRAHLVQLYADVLADGLSLLGIAAPERL